MATETEKSSPTQQIMQNAIQETKSLRAFYTKFNNDWSMNLAAALAYNIMTAMFPIAIALLSILGLFLQDPKAQQDLITKIVSVFPQTIASQDILQTISKQLARVSGILGLIAVLVAIFGGSRLFVLIEACFGIIYHVRPRTLIRQNIMAIGMLLLFVILIPVMLFTASLPAIIFAFVGSKQTPLQAIPGSSFLFSNGTIIASFIGSLIVGWILFQVIYMIVPNQRISFRNSWLGAIIAAVALQLYLTFFSFYASRFLGGYVGQVGFAVITLTFFYYFAVILLIGAEINAFFSENVQPLPNDIVTFVSTMGGTLNKDRPDAESEVHQDSRPTERADRAHVASARLEEQQRQQTNAQKQQQIAAEARRQEQNQQGKKTKSSSKTGTILQVLSGTALAFLLEVLRLRKQGK